MKNPTEQGAWRVGGTIPEPLRILKQVSML